MAVPPRGVLGPSAVRDLYDRLAPVYDVVATRYAVIRADRFHQHAVDALDHRPGDTAIDLACRTGANLPHLARAVGPTGRVLGVDLSPGVLAQARQRVERNGWTNADLVESDVRDVDFSDRVDGVVSTFGLELVPDHAPFIERAVAALAPGGRIAVGRLRRPEDWTAPLIRAGECINRLFGVNRADEDVQPWRAVETHATDVRVDRHLLGAMYLSTGATSHP